MSDGKEQSGGYGAKTHRAVDPLPRRFLFKILTNLVGVAIGIISYAIIPRGLGPKVYGDFSFLTSFFTQIIGFLNFGTPYAFYTKLAQRQREQTLVTFYTFFFLAVSLAVLGLIVFCQYSGQYRVLWPGQKIVFIYAAAFWAILTWLAELLGNMTDSYGATVAAEKARMVQKIIGVAFIIILFVSQELNLTSFFIYHFFLLSFLAVVFVLIIERHGFSFLSGVGLDRDKIKGYIFEFYQYSHPLFIFSLAGLFIGIFDRWILQNFGGSIQQGFYSFSLQIGIICLLFTKALVPLLIREFSIAYEKKDIREIARLFDRYVPVAYGVAAYFACFIAIQASVVVKLFGGDAFQDACIAVMIMSFYPLHQTYGQLTSTVFYAAGKTKAYRNIGIFFHVVGLPLTYYLIAPTHQMGLNFGAIGLAIKMVLINILGVNVQLYFCARLLGLNFNRYLMHQFTCVLSLCAVGILASYSVDYFLNSDGVLLSFLLSGFIYTLLVIGLGYALPQTFGVRREDLHHLAAAVLEKMKKF